MKPFDILGPSTPETPIIVDIPHSGMEIPGEAVADFSPAVMRARLNTDWYLDKLFDSLCDCGVTILRNNIWWYVINVNRKAERPYAGHWTKCLVPEGKPEDTPFHGPVYVSLPSEEEIEQRIHAYYTPYHEALKGLINQSLERFGRTCLISMHSFVGGIDEYICIADGKCGLCSSQIMDLFDSAYSGTGFTVVRNKVFGGGYITRHYGKADNVDPVCIEHRCSTHLLEEELDQPFPPSYDNDKFRGAKRTMIDIYRQIIPGICAIYGVRKTENGQQSAARDASKPRP